MEENVKSLGAKRAELHGDCRQWTPLEALEDLVREIKQGNVKPKELVVHFLTEEHEGRRRHHYQIAGVTFPEHIALLNMALQQVVEEWMV